MLYVSGSSESNSGEKVEQIQTSASDTPGFPGSFMKLSVNNL